MRCATNMKNLVLFAGLASLLVCVACGSGSSSSPTPKGNFSDASLSGQYAYQITGADTTGQFREAGVFTADGNGHITSGEDDFVQGGGPLSGTISGTYAISNDGTGTAAINVSNGRAVALGLTLVSSAKVYLLVIQTNNLATGAGIAEKQDPAAFAAAPSGTFAFTIHNSGVPSAQVGTITVTGGAISGKEDLLALGGTANSQSFTGVLNAPDSSGRGTGTFTDGSSFICYVVDATNLRLLSANPGVLGLGRAEQQTGTSFSNASLSGSYVFAGRGDDNFSIGGVNTVGRFVADGNGGISAGVLDAVQDGNSSTNVPFTGSYSEVSSGRATVILNASATLQAIVWMVSPSRAFFLINDSTTVEDGTLDLQQTTSFSNSTITGQFALSMDGFDIAGNTYDRVGTLRWDGTGHLTLNELINFNGSTSASGFLPGTYSVSSNGRVTGSIGGLSDNLVFYFVSGSTAYVLQNDPGFEINGAMNKQQ